jgi:DNA-binding NarL/FixJ family response regulator
MTDTCATPGAIRLTLADECELVTQGLGAILAAYDDFALVSPSPGGGLATFVDLTLHDAFARLPLCEATMDRLVGRPAGGRYVVYSWNIHADLANSALARGAAGCLSKSLEPDELVEALRAIAAGETVVRTVQSQESRELRLAGLSPRELEMLGLISAGLTNNEIAEATALSINSIKTYIRAAYRKIGAASRSQAVLWAVRNGCVAEPPTGRLVAV